MCFSHLQHLPLQVAMWHVTNGFMWLMATILDSTGHEGENYWHPPGFRAGEENKQTKNLSLSR